MPYILTIFILIIGFTSCSKELPVEELIDIEVEKKIEKFKENKRKRCKNYILREAGKEVDSTMYLRMGSALGERISIPQKPERPPDSFGYSVELDTGPVIQIFTDSVVLDSLK